VVEVITTASLSSTTGGTNHFLLPGSYPAASSSPSQLATSPVLTDARTYLPSGNHFSAGPLASDLVSPGTCWFDVPLELRPLAGTEAQITVFALKAILKNNPPKQGGVSIAHAINRTDWIDSVKNATAEMSVVSNNPNGAGTDLSYAHKIAFNYPWDIVVVNGPATLVAQ
jgi:hypothetical protein